jgi:anti-sigma B factor antagonist
MQIRVTSLKDCEVVAFSGAIDGTTAPEAEQRMLALIEAGHRNLVLNLRDVTYISSAGLKAMLAAQMASHETVPRGEVVLSEVPPGPLRTLEMVGLNNLFRIYDSDDEATASF